MAIPDRFKRVPLHWQSCRIAGNICSAGGYFWPGMGRGPRSTPDDPAKLRALVKRYGITAAQAAQVMRRNYRWHEQHPNKTNTYRWGDIPF